MTPLQQWTVELVGPKGYVHGWIKVGADVEHKDSSRGTIRRYDPATQTAHVDWLSGPRSRVNGGSGTTKAYHLKQGQGLGPGSVQKSPKEQQTAAEFKPNATTVYGGHRLQILGAPDSNGFIRVRFPTGSEGLTHQTHLTPDAAAKPRSLEELETGKKAGTVRRTPRDMTDHELLEEHRAGSDRHAELRQEAANRNLDLRTGRRSSELKQAQDERIRDATGQRMAAEKAKTLQQFKAYGGKVAGEEPTKSKLEYRVFLKGKAYSNHEIHAYNPATEEQVGHISWIPSGNIVTVNVNSGYRRQGVATELWNRAKKIDPAIKHTPDSQSDAGRLWADSLEKPQPGTAPTSKRKHDWVQPGIQVQHKDGSIGKVVAYEPATQTMHVQWASGKRGGTSGTTKAYHTVLAPPVGPKLTGREKALYGTKFPDSAPRPKVEIKRPADPFAGIPNADEPIRPSPQDIIRQKDEADLRKLGLEPISGKETHAQLVDKLTTHYRAMRMPLANSYDEKQRDDLIRLNHRDVGVPRVEADQDLRALNKARVAAYVTEAHRRAPKGTKLPYVQIRDTSGMAGSNDLAEDVAAYYDPRDHHIGVGHHQTTYAEDTPATHSKRGFFSRSGNASFLQRSITHEYGHSLALAMDNNDPYRYGKMGTEVANTIPGSTGLPPGHLTHNAVEKWLQRNKAAVINHVGTYASADHRELMAELYTEFVHAPNPSSAAKVVGKYLEGGGA